jgi:hypothetical protein
MFKHSFTKPRPSTIRLILAGCLVASLVLLVLTSLRPPAQHESLLVRKGLASRESNESKQPGARIGPARVSRQMVGAEAREYMQQPGEGQSLMQALTLTRFGLQKQERGPFGESSGYLAMSHDQNLNAWFAKDGVTVRPTVSEETRERSWHLGLRLKEYGYGDDLTTAPPIASQQVKGTRIEYERSDGFGLRLSNFNPQAIQDLQSATGNRRSAITEWYENRSEGIEEGFTVNERPGRALDVGLK